jgi:hypothetical protein
MKPASGKSRDAAEKNRGPGLINEIMNIEAPRRLRRGIFYL